MKVLNMKNKDELFTIEKIIGVTFANPQHRQYPNSTWGQFSLLLREKKEDPEEIYESLKKKIPNAINNFKDHQVKFFDTSRLRSEIDKDRWIEDLKKLKWFGPYTPEGKDYYQFQTAIVNEQGQAKFQGFGVLIQLGEWDRIVLQMLDW